MYGVDLIKKYEGFREKAYKCPAGVWTVGYGSTTWSNGLPVKRGEVITKSHAEALLVDYINEQINPHIKDLNLKGGQLAAIQSLIYNIGWSSFARSKCYKALKAKDWPTFIREYDWFKGGGKVLPGLLKRRTEELYVFFSEL